MYAIVDIETTGGHASSNSITEICIQVLDGDRVVSHFETLINPCRPIPYYIQSMTGITQQMVANAPLFEEVADQIYSLLHDKIFVAHNVNFDYSFIRHHLAACGFQLQSKKLCTVRLARKILPGFPSYSLGNLCHSLGIVMENRHRAGGDTTATVQLFQLLLKNDREHFITKSLYRNSKESVLPPNVKKEDFESLPYTPGVYYFHNDKGKVVYVGKAKNLRYRVNSHFSNNSDSRQKQNFVRHIHAISFQPCATELMAQILESTEIKRLWPAFNYSQKNIENTYGFFLYEDQRGYQRIGIDKVKKQLRPLHTFHYLTDGHSLLRKLVKEFRLCARLCFLEKGDDRCQGCEEGYCDGACQGVESPPAYNQKVQAAITSLQAEESFAIIENGLQREDKSCILVWEGRFYGMGYLQPDSQISQPEEWKDHVTPYKENLFIRNLVKAYAARFPQKVIRLSPQPIFNPAM